MVKKLGLLPRLIIGIIAGILIGLTGVEAFTRILATFSSIFGSFLSYTIPLLILGFVIPGIAELGGKAGKLLGITAGIAYGSTLLAGTFAYFGSVLFLPALVSGNESLTAVGNAVEPFFVIAMPPIMGVMTALITAFVVGLGIAATNGKTMLSFMLEFQKIIKKVIEKIIIPFLPLHIAGIFAQMAYSGEIVNTLGVFGSVFVFAIAMQFAFILIQYLVAAPIAKKNPFTSIKNMMTAYFTAIGTQSSAATIPVTTQSIKKLKVSDEVAEFVGPLCATIHLSGSTIALVICALAIMTLTGNIGSFVETFPFIMMLGVTMVAAPGVPGGAVMAALGLLESMLGFTEVQLALMMAIYVAQDSFGTATNVTGDGAIALVVDTLSKKFKRPELQLDQEKSQQPASAAAKKTSKA